MASSSIRVPRVRGADRCATDISLRYIGASIHDGERQVDTGWSRGCEPRDGREPGSRPTARPLYTGAVRRHTDYALARRAVLRDLRRGAVTRLDVCDAHPELLRAARHIGRARRPRVPGVRRDERALRLLRLRRRSCARPTAAASCTRASSSASTPRTRSSRATSSRCASTAAWNYLTRRELPRPRSRAVRRAARRATPGRTGTLARSSAERSCTRAGDEPCGAVQRSRPLTYGSVAAGSRACPGRWR